MTKFDESKIPAVPADLLAQMAGESTEHLKGLLQKQAGLTEILCAIHEDMQTKADHARIISICADNLGAALEAEIQKRAEAGGGTLGGTLYTFVPKGDA